MKTYFLCLFCAVTTTLFFANCNKNTLVAPIEDTAENYTFENSDVKFELASLSCPSNIKRLYFFNDWEAICLTSNGIGFITKDKGTTWQPISSPAFTQDLRLVNKTLIASGYQGDSSFIAKSIDNGNTWEVTHRAVGKMQSIAIANDSVIYALNILKGDSILTIFKSNNGGRNWDSVATHKVPYMSTIVAASPTKLYMLTTFGYGYISNDGCRTWTQDKSVDFNSTYSVIFKYGAGYRLLNSAFTQLYKTTNNGADWATVYSTNTTLNKVTAVSPTTIFLFGSTKNYESGDAIYSKAAVYTLDGGNTWKNIEFKSSVNLSVSSFYDDKHGYVVLNDGKLAKITIK